MLRMLSDKKIRKICYNHFMNKSRMEALTDGIFAVVMTLTVLEFKVPENGNLFSPKLLLMLLIYVTTFVALASIWNAHHHVLSFLKSKQVDELILWLNHGLLLVICLFPFATVVHAEHPHSLIDSLAYVAIYLIIWLSLIGFSEVIYRQCNKSEILRLRNRKRIKIFLIFLLPGALLSLIWLYALPIVTLLMALYWGRHNAFE